MRVGCPRGGRGRGRGVWYRLGRRYRTSSKHFWTWAQRDGPRWVAAVGCLRREIGEVTNLLCDARLLEG